MCVFKLLLKYQARRGVLSKDERWKGLGEIPKYPLWIRTHGINVLFERVGLKARVKYTRTTLNVGPG